MEELKTEHPLSADREAHQVFPKGHSSILGRMRDSRLRQEANVSVHKKRRYFLLELFAGVSGIEKVPS